MSRLTQIPLQSQGCLAARNKDSLNFIHTLTSNHPILLFFAAMIAGAINSVAGGGSFISFPSLLVAGIAAKSANATNTAALWPGTVASTFAYRRELKGEVGRSLIPLMITSLIGALVGAQVLLHTPQSTFVKLIPWLLLTSTLLFLASGKITAWVRTRTRHHDGSWALAIGGWLVQLVIAIYTGYFGAGSGILILGLLALMGVGNIHAMNGMKTILVAISNGIALVTFILAKIIVWPLALLMVAGALIGGYGGAHLAQKMNPQHVRAAVIVIGFSMSLYFFVHH